MLNRSIIATSGKKTSKFPIKKLSEICRNVVNQRKMFSSEDKDEASKEQSFEEYWWSNSQNIEWFEQPNILYKKNEKTGLVQWFPDGTTNLSYNCLDANLESNGKEWALVYDSQATDSSGFYTYKQLYRKVNKFAGVLRNLGVEAGDKIVLYMPDIPQSAMANLALWRIGAISVPVHCSYGEKQLIETINDLNPKLIVTASCYVEGENVKYLKQVVDKARSNSENPNLKTLLIQRKFYHEEEHFNSNVDLEFADEVQKVNFETDPVPLPSSHPSYIFSHKQQQVANSYFIRDTGGLAVGSRTSLKENYGVKQRETLMLSSHLAWDMGINYMLLAPLLCGMKTVINEEFYKDNEAYWNLVNKYSVNFLIGHANKINTLASTSDGEFPGKSVNLDSLKNVTFYNGILENEDIDLLNNYITGSQFHNSCYLSFLGTFTLGGANSKISADDMISQPLNKIDIYTEEDENTGSIYNPLYAKSPFYPSAYTDYFSRADTEDVGQFITQDGDFRLPYLGAFDEEGNIRISYPQKEQNTQGKTIETHKISSLLRQVKKVRYAHVFVRDNEIKLKEPCAILLVKEGLDVEEIKNEINELIVSEIGDHNQLGDIYTVTEINKRFDWKVAAEIIKLNGERIVSNMEEDYAQILAQLLPAEESESEAGEPTIQERENQEDEFIEPIEEIQEHQEQSEESVQNEEKK